LKIGSIFGQNYSHKQKPKKMKKLSVKFIGMMMIITMPLLILSSCEKDPCEDTTCENGGTPTEDGDNCKCVCVAGYEGTDCATLSRTKFIKAWGATEDCSLSAPATYSITITAKAGTDTEVLISNLWNLFTNAVVATADGTTLTIASQEPDNDDFFVSGTGTYNSNGTVTLNYTVEDRSASPYVSDVCNNTLLQ